MGCPWTEIRDSAPAMLVLGPVTEEGSHMDYRDLVQYARSLYDAHGDKSEAEAARKAANARTAGRAEDARRWEKIRAQIREMRGAPQG